MRSQSTYAPHRNRQADIDKRIKISTSNDQYCWICCDFPQLPLEIVIQKETMHQPVVIANNRAQKPQVLYANESAQQLGITQHITIATAHSLAPILHIVDREIPSEKERMLELATLLYQFTPNIVIEQEHHQLLLEVSASLKLFGGLSQLFNNIINLLEQTTHRFDFCFANSALAAQCLSYWKREATPTSLIPDLSTVSLHHKQFSIEQLPIQFITDDKKAIRRMKNLGLRTLSDVISLPYESLKKRFGEKFVHRLEKIAGSIDDNLPFFTLPEQFEQSYEFATAVEHINALLFPLKGMLKKLENYLKACQKSTMQIDISLTANEDCKLVKLDFSAPQREAETLLSLLKLRFESIQLSNPVTAITVSCYHLVDSQPKRSDDYHLFQKILAEANEANQLNSYLTPSPTHTTSSQYSKAALSDEQIELLHRLQARLGSGAIKKIEVIPDHRPEKSTQLIPLLTKSSTDQLRSNPEKMDKSKHLTNQTGDSLGHKQFSKRPIWLLPEPIPIKLDQYYLLSRTERIETGWWDSASIARDYYIAKKMTLEEQDPYQTAFRNSPDQAGSLCWIFHDRSLLSEQYRDNHHSKQQWFLQGLFG